MSKNYLDSVSAAFSEAKAWKLTTLILGVVSIILSFQLVNQARQRPVVLVPFHTATDVGRMEVTTSGELRGTSNEYMANLALADLQLILNFNPDNVLSMTKRFLNRVTDSLYQAQEQTLLASAKDNKTRGVTQTFFPSKVSVSTDRTRVEVTGRVITNIGGMSISGDKEIKPVTITYVLTYDATKGYPYVSSITQKNESTR